MRFHRTIAKLLIIAITPVLVACGGKDVAVDTLTIEPGFIRTPKATATATAGFLSITSPVDDTLKSITLDGAKAVEIHDMVTEDGIMRMRRMATVDLQAGEPFVMEPGGKHLMIFSPFDSLVGADTAELVLEFETAGMVSVTIPIGDADHGHHHH